MDQGNETVTAIDTTETPLVAEKTVEIPKVEAKVTSESPKTEAKPDAPVVDAPPAFAPNFKFKVLDKEMEFDDFIKPAIKDKETEAKVREMYEKAQGIGRVKQERQQFREEAAQHKQYIQQATSYLQKNDLRGFFDFVKLPEDKIIEYALERATYRQMSPEQRAQIDGQYQTQHKAMELEQQNQILLQNFQELAIKQRKAEIDAEISKPEVSAISQAFNARMANPEAFLNAVIERGQYHYYKSGVDVPVHQAIAEVLALINGVNPMGVQSQAPNVGGQLVNSVIAGQSNAPVTQQQPIIPNIRGNGTSPVKRVPKNLAEVRKLAAIKLAAQ